jgi:hypothetical protein
MTKESSAKVLDFASFKSRKVLAGDRKESLTDAFQIQNLSERTHAGSATNMNQEAVQGNHNSKLEPDLHERIERIKASIGRINALMAELRQDKK